MSDAVVATVLRNDEYRYVVHLTNVSDGGGESAVTKIDKSGLVAADGAEPAGLDLIHAQWAIQGFSYVKLAWNHTTPDIAALLPQGSGMRDYSIIGTKDLASGVPKADPGSSGGTGDVELTTVTNVSGNTYDIVLEFYKRPASNA